MKTLSKLYESKLNESSLKTFTFNDLKEAPLTIDKYNISQKRNGTLYNIMKKDEMDHGNIIRSVSEAFQTKSESRKHGLFFAECTGRYIYLYRTDSPKGEIVLSAKSEEELRNFYSTI
ncbi:gp16 [Sphingomonas phage PAU]|uniref:gp16 n=1 Tax=Sphingomonas phage PAU TaxID=1150991 RepID=UPI0002573115|nr:gp16 [Sphingomonas phage PAU]AFF28014.1 gp16 [Sphingomonas phage PAU]